jgi:signal transduction histidine kinase
VNGLAALLHRPPADVRLQFVPAPLIVRVLSGRNTERPPPMLKGLRARHRPPNMPPIGREAPFFGHFVAAVRRADGRWVVVEPIRRPFPNSWQRRMLLWLFACLLLVIPAAYLFARRITAPIDRFAQAAMALGRDPNAPPLAEAGPAEISKAAGAFNDMRARVRRYVDDRTAMFGAISHDLRTPLARIRYKLEQAPEPLKASTLRDVEQMEEMIGAVLAFIRDASEPRSRQKLDLLSLAETVVDSATFAGGKAEIVESPALNVDGDALALERMLSNLVDNAVKHAGGARVRLTPVEREVHVLVEDDGPGLEEAELERVFEPFYRGRPADREGGMGLGLSVARSIARAHGGDVELIARKRGLIARVRLPASE